MQTQINQNSWNGKNIFVGIDVHKKSWKVTILSEAMEHKTFSQNPEPKDLHTYLTSNFPEADIYSVYEAGFSGYWASKQLKSLGINNIVVNAADVPTNHKERENKTDSIDSRKLAHSLRAGLLRGIYEPDEYKLSARQFVRTRDQIVKDLAREKNRLKSFFAFMNVKIPSTFSDSETRSISKRYLDWLEQLKFEQPYHKHTLEAHLEQIKFLRKQLLQVTRLLREISRHPSFTDDTILLISIPGIGMISAMKILTELPPMNQFASNDQLNSYIGLIPKVHASGDKQYIGKLTSRGKNKLKETIIECSWVLIRNDPAMLLKYQEMCKRMEPNKAIIRIARKLISRIRHVLIKREQYQLNIY